MTPPPRKPKKPCVDCGAPIDLSATHCNECNAGQIRNQPPNKSLWLYCPKCGVGRFVAGGYNAYTVTRSQIAAAAKSWGWQTVPSFLCENCSNPIPIGHRLKIEFLLERIRYAVDYNQQLAVRKLVDEFTDLGEYLVHEFGEKAFEKYIQKYSELVK